MNLYFPQLTSLNIKADNFAWWTTFKSDFYVPFNISGNISKKLIINVSNDDYSKDYIYNLGTTAYVETAYNALIEKPTGSGVFTLKAYVSNSDNTLNTKAISFNIICVEDGYRSEERRVGKEC